MQNCTNQGHLEMYLIIFNYFMESVLSAMKNNCLLENRDAVMLLSTGKI